MIIYYILFLTNKRAKTKKKLLAITKKDLKQIEISIKTRRLKEHEIIDPAIGQEDKLQKN
ncbi:MAG: hypothetical protein AMR96_03080 [Candidatus Adiutrix intracellularis]|nr:MAG: hypothetical protein AMR96_03080 [Candidatus Adiutrix intracellularis]